MKSRLWRDHPDIRRDYAARYIITEKDRLIEAEAANGDLLMQLAMANGVPGITADCGGEMSCGTCHVILPPEYFGLIPGASADEQVMIDDGVTDPQPTSRLSCQIVINDALDGMTVRVPRQF